MVNVTDSVGTWACLSICWAPLWTDWLWVATPDNHDRLCKEDCAVLSLSAETGLCLRLVPDHYGLFYSPYRSHQSNNVRSHLPRWDDAGAVISSHFREAEWNYQRRAQKKRASLHFYKIRRYCEIMFAHSKSRHTNEFFRPSCDKNWVSFVIPPRVNSRRFYGVSNGPWQTVE